MSDLPSSNGVNTARVVRAAATVPEVCFHNVKLGQGCFCPHCPTAHFPVETDGAVEDLQNAIGAMRTTRNDMQRRLIEQDAEIERLREFLRLWTHVGRLQSFEDRERFRKEAGKLVTPLEPVEPLCVSCGSHHRSPWEPCPKCHEVHHPDNPCGPAEKASGDPYKAVCEGGSGGKCTQPDCEICWPENGEASQK